jgi:hypothetical protein
MAEHTQKIQSLFGKNLKATSVVFIFIAQIVITEKARHSNVKSYSKSGEERPQRGASGEGD